MSLIDDILNLEDGTEDETEYYSAMQRVINEGTGWRLQGSFGRAMMDAIESGKCMLGTKPTSDYYGNRIPSRSEVKPGTKGSYSYVAELSGEDWAQAMKGVA